VQANWVQKIAGRSIKKITHPAKGIGNFFSIK
jgi:hypothetical protein